MAEPKIKPVDNNIEKSDTYKKYATQLNKAMKHGFYLEAIMIEYSIIEDRLKAFLYHIGAISERKSRKIGSKKTKETIKNIVSGYKKEKENDKIGITNISSKNKIIRCVLLWAKDENASQNTIYERTLYSHINERIKIDEYLELLEMLNEWCVYRNEIVHALMNKKVDDLENKLEKIANEGLDYVNMLKLQVERIKYYKKIRKAAMLNNNS